MDTFLNALKKYAVFTGRASREEFWIFILVYLMIASLLIQISTILMFWLHDHSCLYLTSLYGFVLLIPTIAITIRRLHDTDRSGWWGLLFLPFPLTLSIIPALIDIQSGNHEHLLKVSYVVNLAVIILAICFLTPKGTPGSNRFGLNPDKKP